MEFVQDGCDRSGWLTDVEKPLNPVHIVDTMPDFHYSGGLKSMYLDVLKPTEDQRLNRSTKTGLLLRDNETISGPCSLSTAGIEGAKVPPLYKYTNRGVHAFSNLPKSWEDLPRSKPKALIPEHVNRPSNILDSTDIEGTRPHPKNMKIGDEARKTNPMDPRYILPSYPEPFIPLPKFVKNSLDVGDIEGTRPSSSHNKRVERGSGLGSSSFRISDIEGSQPGWKPLHRRHLGTRIRNLCLQVEDINGPIEQRVVRPSTAEVYRDIEGSHSRSLSAPRRPGTPHTLSLRNDDIEGANAGSASWEGTTRKKKEFAESHAVSSKDQKDAEEKALKALTTSVQEQLKRKGLQPGDVAASFHQLDRQNSGRLDMNEVTRAFRTPRLDVDPIDLNSISKAFVHPTGDGYLDYWKLVGHLVPTFPRQRGLQRDTSDQVARSMNEVFKPEECHKPCYEQTWVGDLAAKRDPRVLDGEGGTQFQAFNSGRPVNYSRYLRHPPPSKYRMEPPQSYEPPPDGCQKTIHTPHDAPGAQVTRAPGSWTSAHDQQRHPALNVGAEKSNQNDMREVPVLSVLPERLTQPTWANKETAFQEITTTSSSTEATKKVRGREDSIFFELNSPDHFASDGGENATGNNSVPIFYKLNGMHDYATKPLPMGGPFWPGVVEAQPEDLAPPATRPRPPNTTGPLPMGVPFWSGSERPTSAPRISLRRDYPVPPLFSVTNSEVSLRKAGQKDRVLKTWVDTIGEGASALRFVGEGDQLLQTPGMQGSSFSRPSSAILPLSYEHPSSRQQVQSRPQTATILAHSLPGSTAWFPEPPFPTDRERPQTVNAIVRGSPAENLLLSCNRGPGERKLVSALKRPSTAQSATNSIRTGVTFSPFPSRPCSADHPSRSESSSSARDPHFLALKSTTSSTSRRLRRAQPHQLHIQNNINARGNSSSKHPVSAQRREAQLREEINSIRLLM